MYKHYHTACLPLFVTSARLIPLPSISSCLLIWRDCLQQGRGVYRPEGGMRGKWDEWDEEILVKGTRSKSAKW